MSEEKKEKPFWEGKNFAFNQNTKCEYFPCHKMENTEDFNCLFCYCPLYALGSKCGGAFKYTENGVKDCSGCSLPHVRKNYGYVMEKFGDIIEVAKNNK